MCEVGKERSCCGAVDSNRRPMHSSSFVNLRPMFEGTWDLGRRFTNNEECDSATDDRETTTDVPTLYAERHKSS